MWARPDVLQHPGQLPVCGHTMSCRLPAGLQPGVRAELGLGAGGMLSWGAGQLSLWLVCVWTPPPVHVSGRGPPKTSGAHSAMSRRGPLCPQGRVPSRRVPACSHLGVSLPGHYGFLHGDRSAEAWSFGGLERPDLGEDWGVGDVHIWGHTNTHKTLDRGTHTGT